MMTQTIKDYYHPFTTNLKILLPNPFSSSYEKQINQEIKTMGKNQTFQNYEKILNQKHQNFEENQKQKSCYLSSNKSIDKINQQVLNSYQKKQLTFQVKSQQKQYTSDLNKLKSKLKAYTQSSMIESTQNPQNFRQKNQNEKNARQILAQLEEFHHKKSLELNERKLHQSLKIKNKIIKLNQSKSTQKKVKNIKQAQEKIKFNIQFIQSLKFKPQKEKFFFKQFLHYSQKTLRPKQKLRMKQENPKTIRWQVDNNILKIKNSSKYPVLQKGNQKVEKSLQHLNILIESPLKLPPIDTKNCLKQKPYSIYNIYQKKSEIFTNPNNLNQL